MALAQGALGGLAHQGEGFRQQGVQAFASGHAGLERRGHRLEVGVAQRCEFGLQRIDRGHPGAERLDLAVVGRTEEFFGEAEHRGKSG